jgi:hypothetical protein
MRIARLWGAAALIVMTANSAGAGELKSGIPADGRMVKYKSTKCGGGDDGVELGKSLCYT